jgi:microsomal dipeptidase-like Zn-dependent dipeptidase
MLVGIADTHTHPCSHLGLGGVVYGDPAVPVGELGPCDGAAHGGGYELFDGALRVSRQIVLAATAPALRLPDDRHHPGGAPSFQHWPRWDDGTHQQYHQDWIRRAYDGGLRLMAALAVNNQLLSRLMGHNRETLDGDAIDQQLNAIRRLVAANSFMEIARSPAELRRIVGRDDRLAVVLGVEVDQLERYHPEPPPSPTAPDALAGWVNDLVARLYDAGVRQVTPLHLSDNLFGGFALYGNSTLLGQPYNPFNASNHYLSGRYVEVEPDPALEFRLTREQLRFDPAGAFHADVVEAYDANPGQGHRNARGLTAAGALLVRALLRRGMIVDIDHMGTKTMAATLAIAEAGHYPLLSSHSSFLDLTIPGDDPDGHRDPGGPAATRLDPIPSEFARSDRTMERLRRLGGMVSPGLLQTGNVRVRLGRQADAPVHSSVMWASSYLHAVERMQGAGVGLATDFTLAPSCGPRFGAGLVYSGPPHRPNPQFHPVVYGEPDPTQGADLMAPCVARPRRFDFNTDGLAHVGLLPDLLQDVANLGIPAQELLPLWSSVEAYATMWERCLRAAGERDRRPLSTT